MGDIYTNPPQSRNEAIIRSAIDGTEYTDPPQSRMEDLLLELKEAIEEGGGGGGTSNYNLLSNKPQINGTTLSGNKTTADLIPLDNGLEINSDGEMTVSLGDGLAFNADGEIENQTEANPESAATTELAKLKVGTSIFSVVTKAVNDLANYYTKSDVYTKTEVNNIAQARFQVVAELPVSDIQTNVIYLVPKSTAQTNNDYDEYIYALKSTNPDTYGWEKIGDTEIDLSGYVTTSDLNTALADYTTTAELTTLLAGKQNTLTFDSTPTAQSTNPVTSGGIKSYIDEQGAKTVSGNPITITDAEGMNADHVVATITPTQTGSGTPSPSNVRPFTGFSSVDVSRCGKNLLDPSKIKRTVHGTENANGKWVWWNQRIKCDQSLNYVLNCHTSITSVYEMTIYEYDKDLNFYYQKSYNNINLSNIQIPAMQSNTRYFEIAFYNNTDISSYDFSNAQLEIGTSPTVYEPFNGNQYTVQLGGTYYGGTLDVTSGKLTVTWQVGKVDGLSKNNEHYFYSNAIVGIPNDVNIKCDREATAETTSSYGVCLNGYGVFRINTETAYSSGADCLAAYGGEFNVLYELPTPIEIQLTPTQVELLENNNTITTNVSSLDIKYQANTTIGDTLSVLDKRVTSLESKLPQPPTTDGTYKLTVTVASGTPTYSWESAT